MQYTPELARLELTREADDRLTRIEISQQELTRRLSAVRAEKHTTVFSPLPLLSSSASACAQPVLLKANVLI